MAKKKMSNNSKQHHHQQQQQRHEENVSQPQPPTSSENNTKLETLKNLNSLLLKETTQRRQQVESLESNLFNIVDDNVVSELQKSITFAFIKSRVEEIASVFSSDQNDIQHVVSELGFEIDELKFRLSEEKVREGEIREEKVLEELRKVRSEKEELMEEGLRKEKVIEEVMSERDSAVSKWRELKNEVVEAENRENKVLDELRKVRVEGEKLGLERERVIVEVREERDSAVRESRKLKEKLIEEGGRKERVIDEVTVERNAALSDSRELKEKILEAENSNRKLLDELQKVKLEGDKLIEEGSRKDRLIGEVTVERDLAVRDSRELKETLLEAENSKTKLLEELQKVRLEWEKLAEEGHRKERVIGEVTMERDSAVRDSRELKEKLLEAENSNKRLLEELQNVRLDGEKLIEEGHRKERVIGEVTVERDSAVRSLRESMVVIEKLKEEMDLVMREKDEISKVNDSQKVKISSMDLELANVNEALNDVRKEEKLMRGKILELEVKVGIYVKKEEELMLQIRDLVKQKEEIEGNVEMLKEGRDCVEKVLADMKQQSEVLQKSVHEAHKMKSLWTMVSSGASILAAAFAAAYVTKGH
ncbi:hypothetical protein Lalb_Chr18g0045421 [Lupinus albus]|uniref:Uncharacterized protein n=1 Tax=Lupinus albus TaxID=3870 RepID=A0A6A4NWW0_LUPAL|nr:hypothetical protein Lalb_Chr18g0045421 [Lupinus albus]